MSSLIGLVALCGAAVVYIVATERRHRDTQRRIEEMRRMEELARLRDELAALREDQVVAELDGLFYDVPAFGELA